MIKKKLAWVLGAGLGLAVACTPASAGDSREAAAPSIHCDQPEVDVGKVIQGEDVVHVFKIKNKGKGLLKLERARGG